MFDYAPDNSRREHEANDRAYQQMLDRRDRIEGIPPLNLIRAQVRTPLTMAQIATMTNEELEARVVECDICGAVFPPDEACSICGMLVCSDAACQRIARGE